MIIILTATPGCGKTNHAEWSHIKPAVEAERSLHKQAPQDGDRLHHPLDPGAGWVEGDSGGQVLRLVPAGADAYHQPPIADQVEGREILGQDGRMPQIVVEHQRAEAEPFGPPSPRRPTQGSAPVAASGGRGW